MHLPVLARILCSLLTKSAMYCLLTVLEEPAEAGPILVIVMSYQKKTGCAMSQHAANGLFFFQYIMQ